MRTYIIISLFILLIIISCDWRKNSQTTSIPSPVQNYKKEIIIEDLEVLNTSSPFGFPSEDHGWQPVKIPLINKLAEPYLITPFKIKYRCLWIRGKFDLEAFGTYRPFGINLGLVAAANAVYINNSLIGEFEFNPERLDRWLWPSSYILPADIALKEKNIVYIRFTTDRKYLTLISDIVIQDQSSYTWSQKWINFLYSQLPVGFSILLLGILIILLKNYFLYNNKRYLLYSLYLLILFLNMLITYSPTNFLKLEISMAINYVLGYLRILLIILIFQSLYGIYFTKQNIISALIMLLIPLYILVKNFPPFDIKILLMPWKFIYYPLLAYLICLIYLLNRHKPDKFKLKFVISLFISWVIINAITNLGVKLNVWYYYFHNIYSMPVYAAFIIIYEAKEAKKRRIEFKKIHGILEKNKNNNTLTESAEKKIENVINFLNENYKEDISREGLASAVDMSPNYMSNLFYKHTGKKIKDYINHLRVTDAAKRLEASSEEKKIIDIALGVGFESLATFNRAFRKIYKITPTEYRKRYADEPQ